GRTRKVAFISLSVPPSSPALRVSTGPSLCSPKLLCSLSGPLRPLADRSLSALHPWPDQALPLDFDGKWSRLSLRLAPWHWRLPRSRVEPPEDHLCPA